MMNQFGPNGLNGVCRDLTHLDGLNQIDCIVFEIASDPSLIIMEKIIINAPEIFMKSNKTISRYVSQDNGIIQSGLPEYHPFRE